MTKLTLINCDLSERLKRHGWRVVESGCWEWAGKSFHKFGYGKIRVCNKGYDAHRIAYLAWVGEIPKGMQVRHTCDNPPCINPNHLVLGTSQQNHDDMVTRGRALTGERNPAAKLTDDEVNDIRTLYALGASQGQIAKAYSVAQSHVSLLVNNKRRKGR